MIFLLLWRRYLECGIFDNTSPKATPWLSLALAHTHSKHRICCSLDSVNPLTERIKNILKGYPCDDTILKELVQNADDSCATEVPLSS